MSRVPQRLHRPYSSGEDEELDALVATELCAQPDVIHCFGVHFTNSREAVFIFYSLRFV